MLPASSAPPPARSWCSPTAPHPRWPDAPCSSSRRPLGAAGLAGCSRRAPPCRHSAGWPSEPCPSCRAWRGRRHARARLRLRRQGEAGALGSWPPAVVSQPARGRTSPTNTRSNTTALREPTTTAYDMSSTVLLYAVTVALELSDESLASS